MWIRVRSMDGRTNVRLEGISKITKIEDLREKLVEHFNAKPSQQRLFFRGKQMEDGQTLFDYDVNLNDLIQIIVRDIPSVTETQKKAKNASTSSGDEGFGSNKENSNMGSDYFATNSKSETKLSESPGVLQSSYYKIKDRIEAWDEDSGCWYEAQIIKITKTSTGIALHDKGLKATSSVLSKCDDSAYGGMENNNNNEESPLILFDVTGNVLDDADDGFLYHIYYSGFEEGEPCKVKFNAIRPCSYKKLAFSEINVGDTVLANYFIENPKKRGFFYEATITKKSDTRTNKELLATVHVRRREIPLDKCVLAFPDEIFRIEKPVYVSYRAPDLEYWMQVATLPKREIKPDCDFCKDKKSVKCKHCCCVVCGGKDHPSKQILCDECNRAFHLWCLDPPIESLPEEEDWYCQNCRNDVTEVVRAGEKLKESKKKAKMQSKISNTTRDWGKGMACVGRTKQCTIVDTHHMGPVPGVEVGSCWRFRMQASEAGVHRPHVAGIHGKEPHGAFSIVLAGGYEDDKDDGEEFTYTGSGGRDLSGNKRTAQQSSNQKLTRMNKCLAINCNAKINDKTGAEAANWKAGKPVRVLRSANKKHSKYSPEIGVRYDGIYKVVKYWAEKGQSGFIVWRYLLRRDDPIPSPWSKAGKKRMAELGLEIVYPEGYLDKQAEKTEQKSKGKRANTDDDSGSPKRSKQTNYKLPKEVEKLIKQDEQNKTLWDECLLHVSEGQPKFIAKVEELFMCICCQDLVSKPITTECCHNVCHECLSRSFKSKMFNCPACRHLLGDKYTMNINKTLDAVLRALFPGYAVSRD